MNVQQGGEEHRVPASQTQQPQKRACATCARLKMKCQWPNFGNGDCQNACLRCNRMKIPCSVPPPQSRRKRGKGTRVAQLEQKIDGLVSLLHAGQHIQPQRQSTLTPESLANSHTTRPPSPFQSNTESGNQQAFAPAAFSTISDNDGVAFELVPGFQLSKAQARDYLDVFRHTYMPHFPYVLLSDHLTVDELYATDHCLFWTVISTVAPLPAELQPQVKSKIRGQISERVVVQHEKSLYILQAILVYLAWSEWHLFFDTQAMPMIQIAHSLVTDLKLDRSVKSITLPSRTLLGDAWESFKQPNTKVRAELSMAEKRALLGTYHLSSLIAALYRRGLRPTWTSHYSQCCESLSNTPEHRSDVLIAAHLDLHRILDRVLLTMPSYLGSETIFTTPLEMFLSNTARELADAVERLPDDIKSSKALQMSYYVLLLRLYEPIAAMQPPSLNHPSTQARTDILFKSLQHAKSFFDIYLSLSPIDLNCLPTPTFALHAFANYSASRLLICDPTPDWDPVIARREIDFHVILKRGGQLMESADQSALEQGWKRRVFDNRTTVAFEKFAAKLHWIAEWYLIRLGADQGEEKQVTDDVGGREGFAADGLGQGAFESGWLDLMDFQDAGLFENFNF